MAIGIITGFDSNSRETLDKRSGPYESVGLALTALDTYDRHVGLEIIIITDAQFDQANNYIGGTPVKYVFKGGITDSDLVRVDAHSTGLEAIDEGKGVGWRLIGKHPSNYADIGLLAVDLSDAGASLTDRGASGTGSFAVGMLTKATATSSFAGGYGSEALANYSLAIGYYTIASAESAVSLGKNTVASGIGSFVSGVNSSGLGASSFSAGLGTIAKNTGSIALGRYNLGTAMNTVVEIGNGADDTNRSNIFEAYLDGKIVAPALTVAIIDGEPDDSKILITKEYVKSSAVGSGDMSKNTYDKNDNGIVDDSEKLGGHDSSYYATKTELDGKLDDVIAGENITIDKTDPNKPIISSTGSQTGGDKHFIFSQGVPDTLWEIKHDMTKYPAVVVVDSAESVVVGKIEYIDNNNLKLTFNAAFSGKAYLN